MLINNLYHLTGLTDENGGIESIVVQEHAEIFVIRVSKVDGALVLGEEITLDNQLFKSGSQVRVLDILQCATGDASALVGLDETPVAVCTISPLNPDFAYQFNKYIPNDDLNERASYLAITLIKTENGEIPIADIKLGDRVITRDHGYQTVRWIKNDIVPSKGPFAPLKLSADILGIYKDLVVTPGQSLLISGALSELYLGADETLVTAQFLENGQTIARCESDFIEVAQLMFDQHEIIWANGCLCASLKPPAAAQMGSFNSSGSKAGFDRPEKSTKLVAARSSCRRYEGRVIAAALL